MKHLLMIVFCALLLVGPAQGDTIVGIYLYGGDGATFDSWVANGERWGTLNNGDWVLGVSSAAGGPLLNHADTTVSGLLTGNYYLYAEPTALGENPQLNVYFSSNPSYPVAAIFAGASGSGTAWTWEIGDSALSLGWAVGTADLVGPGNSMVPSGTNDFYLQTGIHVVPLPGAVWLLSSGLLSLAGWRRFRKS